MKLLKPREVETEEEDVPVQIKRGVSVEIACEQGPQEAVGEAVIATQLNTGAGGEAVIATQFNTDRKALNKGKVLDKSGGLVKKVSEAESAVRNGQNKQMHE